MSVSQVDFWPEQRSDGVYYLILIQENTGRVCLDKKNLKIT